MPYIEQNRRDEINQGDIPRNEGELNYAIYKLLLQFVNYQGPCYSTFNGILGAILGAVLEFYRRVVAPYEEQKREYNGDVYL